VATTKSAIRLDEEIVFSQFLLEKKINLGQKKNFFPATSFGLELAHSKKTQH